jgi:hypothetical protein
MQLARSIFERITAQAILPMTTLGVSGAIAVAVMELLRSFHEEQVLAPAHARRHR